MSLIQNIYEFKKGGLPLMLLLRNRTLPFYFIAMVSQVCLLFASGCMSVPVEKKTISHVFHQNCLSLPYILEVSAETSARGWKKLLDQYADKAAEEIMEHAIGPRVKLPQYAMLNIKVTFTMEYRHLVFSGKCFLTVSTKEGYVVYSGMRSGEFPLQGYIDSRDHYNVIFSTMLASMEHMLYEIQSVPVLLRLASPSKIK